MKAVLPTMVATVLLAGTAAADAPSPYAGWQGRDIKALSLEQIADLKAGRGMGLALAAELNGYPGPRHVLDLGDELALTGEQRTAFEALFREMQAEAQRLGAAILTEEAELDRAFRSGRADDASLRDRLARLGALQGELRHAHLRAHLTARELLSAAQVARYNALRGYRAEHGGAPVHREHPIRSQRPTTTSPTPR